MTIGHTPNSLEANASAIALAPSKVLTTGTLRNRFPIAPRNLGLSLLMSCLALALPGCSTYEAMNRANSEADTASATGKGPCDWQCLDWAKTCEIDGRGVNKCVRSCREFKKSCE